MTIEKTIGIFFKFRIILNISSSNMKILKKVYIYTLKIVVTVSNDYEHASVKWYIRFEEEVTTRLIAYCTARAPTVHGVLLLALGLINIFFTTTATLHLHHRLVVVATIPSFSLSFHFSILQTHIQSVDLYANEWNAEYLFNFFLKFYSTTCLHIRTIIKPS